MADSKKYNGSTWEHSLRKLTTSTDTITSLPADLYADGNNATVGISGNTVQNGTPTPSNPIQPSECGDMSSNMFDINAFMQGVVPTRCTVDYNNLTNTITINSTGSDANTGNNNSYHIPVIGGETYTLSWGTNSDVGVVYIFENGLTDSAHLHAWNSMLKRGTLIARSDTTYFVVRVGCDSRNKTKTYTNIMLNTGDTPLSYQPYGQYKIPISSGGVTTNIYLDSTQTVRQVKKYTFTGEETVFSCVTTTDRQNYCVAYRFMDFGMTDIKDFDKMMKDIDYPIFISTHFKEKTNTNSDFNDIQPNQVGANTVSAANNRYIIFCVSGLTTAANYSAWFAQQYANGTPVEVYYILETETTGIVNEPLRKIGNYADTVSGITIPTITGADSFDVLTTLKPSEVNLTYTGWHDATVEEWDGSEWQ